MNETKQKHNELTFLRSEGGVFILCAQDRHHDACPQSIQIQNDANLTVGFHLEIQVNKKMLAKFCAGNYSPHDGLVNGADGIL
jgi:hypothetical protein